MVSPGDEQISLVLTVDKAELERQLESVFGGGAGGAGGAAGGVGGIKATTGETGGKGMPVQPGAGFVRHLKHLAILVGIPLSLAALIKSSKLLSGALSAIQTVFGAMVDSFLMPFMPGIFKGIAWMAEHGIPAAIKAGEITKDILGDIKDLIFGGNQEQVEAIRSLWTRLQPLTEKGPIGDIKKILTGNFKEMIEGFKGLSSKAQKLNELLGKLPIPGMTPGIPGGLPSKETFRRDLQTAKEFLQNPKDFIKGAFSFPPPPMDPRFGGDRGRVPMAEPRLTNQGRAPRAGIQSVISPETVTKLEIKPQITINVDGRGTEEVARQISNELGSPRVLNQLQEAMRKDIERFNR